MLRLLLFLTGLAILIGAEALKVYYIMPFPGSQVDTTVDAAYFLHNNIWWIRLLGLAIVAWPAWTFLASNNIWKQWTTVVALAVWLFVWYVVSSNMMADQMFRQPTTRTMATVSDNKIPLKDLVVAVTSGTESRAYPIEIIAYHHQVRDSIAGRPVMVTYCSVCRTGRVFSPVVDGEPDQFRLVGMDHFNAMFEDSRTKSWWRQANGEAITGAKNGTFLEEIPSEQMTLAAWIEAHPATKILQRDPEFIAYYDSAALYDEGKMKNNLERTDTVSWQDKSWVIGVQAGEHAKAYDWLETLPARVVNDQVGSVPVTVAIGPDSASFHVWQRPDTLTFRYDAASQRLIDEQTNSVWSWQGISIDGPLKGSRLDKQRAYQEYWHSWRTFHPNTARYQK